MQIAKRILRPEPGRLLISSQPSFLIAFIVTIKLIIVTIIRMSFYEMKEAMGKLDAP